MLNGIIDDTILVQITSTRHGLPNSEVVLDPAIENLSGLAKVCVASCTNLMTFDQSFIVRRIGVLSPAVMKRIEACLKAVMDIP